MAEEILAMRQVASGREEEHLEDGSAVIMSEKELHVGVCMYITPTISDSTTNHHGAAVCTSRWLLGLLHKDASGYFENLGNINVCILSPPVILTLPLRFYPTGSNASVLPTDARVVLSYGF